jgi:microcystin-dependent protein
MKRLFAMACFVLSLTSTWGGNAAHAQEPYLGEIRLFGYNWCPRGWQQANGAILSISQNTALFSLYGTNFGGNGVSTFGLPNLSGSAPYGQQGGPFNSGQPFAAVYGQTSVTLTTSNLPAHTHQLMASTVGPDAESPSNAILGTFPTGQNIYANPGSPANVPMASNAIGFTGNNLPVSTQSPALSLNWCVATTGIYPSRN